MSAILTLAVALSPVSAGISSDNAAPSGHGPDNKGAVAILVIEQKPIAFIREYVRDTNIPRGRLKKVRDGKDGILFNVYRDTFQNGEKVKRQLVYQGICPAESEMYLVGVEGYQTSRGSFSGRRVLEMIASGYDPSPRSCGKYATGYTYTGLKATYGVVAVDPKVIPLGTRLYVEGYGYAIAADVGSGIKGNRIDLCFPTWKEADAYGRKRVRVHILD